MDKTRVLYATQKFKYLSIHVGTQGQFYKWELSQILMWHEYLTKQAASPFGDDNLEKAFSSQGPKVIHYF